MSMPFIKSSHAKRHQAITDIIESFALEECAISHILNAEGEELQKVVCFSDLSADQIIAVNNSLSELVKNLTYFEKELKEKLHLLEGCMDCDDRYYDDKFDEE